MGQAQPNATHSANFGVGLKEKLDSLGVECELVYPGLTEYRHEYFVPFFIEMLNKKRD